MTTARRGLEYDITCYDDAGKPSVRVFSEAGRLLIEADRVVIGSRDLRTGTPIAANLKPGDSILHSTGPGSK